jgi:hypothetical protein
MGNRAHEERQITKRFQCPRNAHFEAPSRPLQIFSKGVLKFISDFVGFPF